MPTTELIAPPSKQQITLANKALDAVDLLADSIRQSQHTIEKDFVSIGKALMVVEQGQHWMHRQVTNEKGDLVPCPSFSDYLKMVEKRAERKRTQLYHCLGVAKDVLPFISEEELVKLGITKATTLRKMVNEGYNPSDELLRDAPGLTNTQLKEKIAETTGLFLPENEEGQKWYDLGSVPFTPDQVEVFLRMVRAALRELEIDNIPIEHWEDYADLSPSLKAEIMEAQCADFLSGAE